MRNLPVFWHEGMFLRPQHFQAADRYWTEINEVSQQLDHPYYYGLRAASLSEEAIANNQFQLNSCRARMRDGTVVNLEIGQEPDRLDMRESATGALIDSADLTDAFEDEARIRVFLATPKLKLGRANVAKSREEQDCRFLPVASNIQDQTDGSNQEEVELLSLNTRLLLSTQSHAGYEVLPIAQVKRSGANSVPVIDNEYIPPLLAIEAWPGLSRDIIRVIYDRLGENINLLAEQVGALDVVLASREAEEMRNLLFLSRLNEAFAAVSNVTFAAGVHPFVAYAELCRAIGQLALFMPARKCPDFPRYDHDNLYPIFKWIKDQIEALMAYDPAQPEKRFFKGVGVNGMQVELDPRWLAEGWNWYIGVNRGNLPEVEVREILKPGPTNLDWKFGSASMVSQYFTQFQPGLRLDDVTQAPKKLPMDHWVYYQVRRDNEAWPHVKREETLAMRVRPLLVMNKDALSGNNNLVVRVKNQNVILQFALFAVPPLRK